MAAETQYQRKNRLSNLFSRQKSSEDFNNDRPGPSPNGADSAYASSDPPSHRTSPESRNANVVSIDNHGQISGVAGNRNLALNKTTGEVLDQDTGEVVTTVTTTTTTTTTTVRKGQGVEKGTTVQVETRPGDPNGTAQLVEAPGDSRLRPGALEPRQRSPAPIQVPPPPQPSYVDAQPVPPVRHPNRKSREYPDPSSPATRTNFSHPSRSDLRGPTATGEENGYLQHEYLPPSLQNGPQSRASQPSAYDNLKAAAVGLHGVGETLRGTLNSTVDSRFPRQNTEKAAAADAKNRAALEGGHREMARLREVNGLRPTVSQQSASGAPQIPMPYQSASGAPQIPSNEQIQRMNATDGRGPGQLHAPGTWGSGRASDVKGEPAVKVAPMGTHPAHRTPQPEQRSPDGFTHRQENARQEPVQRFDSARPPSQPGAGADAGAGSNAAGKVQAVSHVQGNSAQQEPEEEPRGLRKLFKRKGVGAG